VIANRGGASGFLQAFIRPEDRGFDFNSRAASPNDRNVFEPLRFRKDTKAFHEELCSRFMKEVFRGNHPRTPKRTPNGMPEMYSDDSYAELSI